MSPLISWIKKELIYIKDSFIDIIKGFIFFVLATSGLAVAIFLRYSGYNGTAITFVGLLVEFISLILCYFFFKRHLKSKEELEKSDTKHKVV
jgi:hypothetical protein